MVIKLSWKKFDLALKYFENNLQSVNPFIKNIYGIARGGLIIAVALSHRLNKPLLLDKNKISKGTLIVDDISDTGVTLTKLLKDKQWLRTATVCTKDETKFVPTYSYIKVKKSDWLIFPWETELSSKKDK